jgi:hypothetical protein
MWVAGAFKDILKAAADMQAVEVKIRAVFAPERAQELIDEGHRRATSSRGTIAERLDEVYQEALRDTT